jgi:hypothetical protein
LVVHVFALAAVTHVGPDVTDTAVDVVVVVVVVVHLPMFAALTLQWFVPWHVVLPQAQVPKIITEPSADPHVEAGDGPLTRAPDAS